MSWIILWPSWPISRPYKWRRHLFTGAPSWLEHLLANLELHQDKKRKKLFDGRIKKLSWIIQWPSWPISRPYKWRWSLFTGMPGWQEHLLANLALHTLIRTATRWLKVRQIMGRSYLFTGSRRWAELHCALAGHLKTVQMNDVYFLLEHQVDWNIF